jgi:hypothetical protein
MNKKLLTRMIILLAVLLIASVVILGQTKEKAKVVFSAKDRETILAYYTHEIGTLAPGSLDRKGFPVEVEKELKPGGKVPLQLKKNLDRLPAELEAKLTEPPGGYQFFKLGHHILIVQTSDLTIADIIKDAGWK